MMPHSMPSVSVALAVRPELNCSYLFDILHTQLLQHPLGLLSKQNHQSSLNFIHVQQCTSAATYQASTIDLLTTNGTD